MRLRETRNFLYCFDVELHCLVFVVQVDNEEGILPFLLVLRRWSKYKVLICDTPGVERMFKVSLIDDAAALVPHLKLVAPGLVALFAQLNENRTIGHCLSIVAGVNDSVQRR